MRGTFRTGACALALVAFCASSAIAKHGHATKCAAPSEVTAIAATSIQQELMVAALTCNQISNFNAFQTNFGPELRASDHTLMQMFRRLYGGRGEGEYHAFKTRLANNSEMRSIHGNQDFCTAAGLVFAAALAAVKPTLSDFVSGVQVEDPSPVNSCQMQVSLSLSGAMAAPAVTPRQKPAQFEDISLPGNSPALPQAVPAVQHAVETPGATGTPPAPPAQTTTAAANAAATTQTPEQASADQPKKKKGFLSGLFN